MDLSSNELFQANAEMRAILGTFPDAFIWLDDCDRITRFQNTNVELFGFAHEIRVGQQLSAACGPQITDQLLTALEQARSSSNTVTIEYKLVLNGEEKAYEARLISMEKKRSLIVVRDVTQKKRLEECRLQSSKLDSVGLLAGGIAHDFNNILATILANTSLVSLDAPAGSELEELMGDINAGIARAQSLTLQLLTFSKGGSPIKQTASLKELIIESARFCLRGSNVSCEFDLDEKLWRAEVDQGQMSQVMNNLIINADQAMPNGGRITIRARNVHSASESQPGEAAPRLVQIKVIDSGLGIAEEHMGQIFDPYFTTKREGNGLGLATSYAIVKKHDGLLSAESVPGRGTTFIVTLPAVSCDDGPIPSSRDFIPPSSRRRILLMDDDAHIRTSASRLLRRLGYDPVVACDGAEAIEIYKLVFGSVDQFKLVIMDLTVPGGMGGIEALRALLDFDPQVKVIASSGYSSEFDLATYREHGFSDILPKPYDVQSLSRVLSRSRSDPPSYGPKSTQPLSA